MFDLGTCGNEPARRVAELSNVYNAAAAASRELFRGASADRKGAAVKYIAPIGESWEWEWEWPGRGEVGCVACGSSTAPACLF